MRGRARQTITITWLLGCVPDNGAPPVSTDPLPTDDSGGQASDDDGLKPCFALPNCDPLSADCESNELCLPEQDTFTCTPRVEGTTQMSLGEACDGALACQEGSLCLSVSVGSCTSAPGCCVALCELEAPDCGAGLSCTPFFAGGGPSCYASVGVCVEA